MSSGDEQNRRREIKFELRAKQKQALLDALPMPIAVLQGLLDHLDETLFERKPDGRLWCYCDHTRARTMSFLRGQGVDEVAAAKFFDGVGGYCDCEIAANVPTACERILEDE